MWKFFSEFSLRSLISVLCLVFCLSLSAEPPITLTQPKSVLGATALSLLFPGLGHFYLEDYPTAFGLSGAGVTELAVGLTFKYGPQFPDSKAFTNLSFTYLQNTYFYSIYAAYRDSRSTHLGASYLYDMPKDGLDELAFAPINWRVLKKPEVWLGLLGAVLLGTGISYLSQSVFPFTPPGSPATPLTPTQIVANELYYAAMTPSIGIGEEAFFRGFAQPVFSEFLTPPGGIAASSLLFGAAHIPNAYLFKNANFQRGYFALSLPFLTSLGAYLGWVSFKNKSIQETVALHTWYDFVMFSMAIFSSSIAAGSPNFSFTIPF